MTVQKGGWDYFQNATRVTYPASDMSASLNRDHTTVGSTREKHTWDGSDGVTEITIVARNTANPSTDYTSAAYSDQRIDHTWLAVTFNAPDDATANTWLTQVDSDTAASPLYLIQAGVPRTFRFDSPVTRIDYKRAIGVLTLNVSIEANAV